MLKDAEQTCGHTALGFGKHWKGLRPIDRVVTQERISVLHLPALLLSHGKADGVETGQSGNGHDTEKKCILTTNQIWIVTISPVIKVKTILVQSILGC